MTAVSWCEHLSPTRSTFSFVRFHSFDRSGIQMNHWMLAIAWGAALASLYLVADMITTDFVCRRAERVALRRPVGADARFRRR
jgi:hypothetical protein